MISCLVPSPRALGPGPTRQLVLGGLLPLDLEGKVVRDGRRQRGALHLRPHAAALCWRAWGSLLLLLLLLLLSLLLLLPLLLLELLRHLLLLLLVLYQAF